MRYTTGYMDHALFDLPDVIENAIEELSDIDFDTLVGTGFSGGVLVPVLALTMRKNFLLVRKPNDNSHHSGTLLGEMGERWVFVDDFISSGETHRRVMREIASRVATNTATYVGDYMYRKAWFRGNGFTPAGPQPEPEPEMVSLPEVAAAMGLAGAVFYEDTVTVECRPAEVEEKTATLLTAMENWQRDLVSAQTITGRFVSRNLTPESFPDPL